MHTDNRKKDSSVLGEDPTQGLDNTTTTVDGKNYINVTASEKKFCLSTRYNGSSRFCC